MAHTLTITNQWTERWWRHCPRARAVGEVLVAKSNETVLQVAILAGVDTRVGTEEEVFSRGCKSCNLRDLMFLIWLPPRVVLLLLNRAIVLHHLKKQRRKRSFVRVLRMSMHLSRSVDRFNEWISLSTKLTVNTLLRGESNVAMCAHAVWFEMQMNVVVRWCLFDSTVWERWSLPRKRLQLFQQPGMSLICTAASPPSSSSALHREISSHTGKHPYWSPAPSYTHLYHFVG